MMAISLAEKGRGRNMEEHPRWWGKKQGGSRKAAKGDGKLRKIRKAQKEGKKRAMEVLCVAGHGKRRVRGSASGTDVCLKSECSLRRYGVKGAKLPCGAWGKAP